MSSQTKYTLVFTKVKGNVTPIEWTNIPSFNGGLDGHRLQTIDEFTSKFSDEKELKEFILQYGEEIGLDIRSQRDKLSDILRNYLMKYFDEKPSDWEIRKQLSAISDSSGLNNQLKVDLNKMFKSGADDHIKRKGYEALVRKNMVNLIMNPHNSYLDDDTKNRYLNFIKRIDFTDELSRDLEDYVSSSKLNYAMAKFPLDIVYYNNRRLSKLISGIAYVDDVKYIDPAYLASYLIDKARNNDFELLNRLNDLYGRLPHQIKNVNWIKIYIESVKSQSAENVKVPESAIKGLINNESYVYDETTKSNKIGRDGKSIINYLGLRKLGMFISKYEKEKEIQHNIFGTKKNTTDDLERRVSEIPVKTYKQLDFFSDIRDI